MQRPIRIHISNLLLHCRLMIDILGNRTNIEKKKVEKKIGLNQAKKYLKNKSNLFQIMGY